MVKLWGPGKVPYNPTIIENKKKGGDKKDGVDKYQAKDGST